MAIGEGLALRGRSGESGGGWTSGVVFVGAVSTKVVMRLGTFAGVTFSMIVKAGRSRTELVPARLGSWCRVLGRGMFDADSISLPLVGFVGPLSIASIMLPSSSGIAQLSACVLESSSRDRGVMAGQALLTHQLRRVPNLSCQLLRGDGSASL